VKPPHYSLTKKKKSVGVERGLGGVGKEKKTERQLLGVSISSW